MTGLPKNPYAIDGRCHNANVGTLNHECGKPATWIGINHGFGSGFCDYCKEYGDESHGYVAWMKIEEFRKLMGIEDAREDKGSAR